MHKKQELRDAVAERLAKLSEKDRGTESRIVCKELKKMLGSEPKTIAAYMPLSDEPNIRPLLEELIAAGWRIAIPGLGRSELEFRLVENLDETRQGKTRILEPTNEHVLVDRTELSCVIIPGRAFTRNGERMGRGNGGYDRWIVDQKMINPETAYIGVCFECQVVSDMPTEPHDQNVDMVVTYRGMMKI